jgi:hypothetical protein
MVRRGARFLLIVGACLSCGCFNPQRTRLPEVVPRNAEYERIESQIHDPYPDRDQGPDTGFRPREFAQQRSEPQRSRDRSYVAALRERLAPEMASPAFPPAWPPQNPVLGRPPQ